MHAHTHTHTHTHIQKINREVQFNYEILNPLHITGVKKRKDDSGGSTKSHIKNVGVAVSSPALTL